MSEAENSVWEANLAACTTEKMRVEYLLKSIPYTLTIPTIHLGVSAAFDLADKHRDALLAMCLRPSEVPVARLMNSFLQLVSNKVYLALATKGRVINGAPAIRHVIDRSLLRLRSTSQEDAREKECRAYMDYHQI
jgi:hypothetical protein